MNEAYPYVMNILSLMDFKTILQVDCGNGEFLPYLLAQKPNIEIHGTDQSVDNLENIIDMLGDKIFLIRSSATHIPYPDNSFDVLISLHKFNSYLNYEQVLGEFKRVLRPGGTLIISDSANSIKAVRYAASLIGKLKKEPQNKYYTEDEIKETLLEAGFENPMWHKISQSTYLARANKPKN